MLRKDFLHACLHCINDEPFTVECDASDLATGTTLKQSGRLVAFMSRTLTENERRYPKAKKRATAIIEAISK